MRAAPRDQVDRTLCFQAFSDLAHEINGHAEHACARGDVKPLPEHGRNSATHAGWCVAIGTDGGFHDGTHSHHQLEQLERDDREHVGDREPQCDTAGGDPPAELAFEFRNRREARGVGEHEQEERDRRGTPMAV